MRWTCGFMTVSSELEIRKITIYNVFVIFMHMWMCMYVHKQ